MLLVTRREDSSDTRKIRIGRTKISTIFKVTRNGRTIKTTYGGTDAGETAGTKLYAHFLSCLCLCLGIIYDALILKFTITSQNSCFSMHVCLWHYTRNQNYITKLTIYVE